MEMTTIMLFCMKIKILNRDVERITIFLLLWNVSQPKVQPFSHNLLKLSGFLCSPNNKVS